MLGIIIGSIIWSIIVYLVLCLPLDLEIKKIRKDREKRFKKIKDFPYEDYLVKKSKCEDMGGGGPG